MGQHVLPGNPPVVVNLRRSARARRISLRVSGLDGRVTLTLPKGVSEGEGLDFVRTKADWVRGHMAATPLEETVGLGTVLPVEGAEREVVQGTGRRVVLGNGEIAVPGREDQMGRKLQAWLKELARDRLAGASDRYADLLGVRYNALSLRDTRSRWGSCSAQGRLMYSWRLILAPREVLTYVAAHEVAHLREMNHSPAFWNTVQSIYGDHRQERAWLRTNGSNLHRFRFGN